MWLRVKAFVIRLRHELHRSASFLAKNQVQDGNPLTMLKDMALVLEQLASAEGLHLPDTKKQDIADWAAEWVVLCCIELNVVPLKISDATDNLDMLTNSAARQEGVRMDGIRSRHLISLSAWDSVMSLPLPLGSSPLLGAFHFELTLRKYRSRSRFPLVAHQHR